jgi:hypothetical protein
MALFFSFLQAKREARYYSSVGNGINHSLGAEHE